MVAPVGRGAEAPRFVPTLGAATVCIAGRFPGTTTGKPR